MKDGAVSFLHRLDADEMFHFHMGDPIMIVQLSKDVPGHTRKTIMGTDDRAGQSLFHVVKLGTWFGIIASADSIEEAGVLSVVRLRLFSSFPDLRVE